MSVIETAGLSRWYGEVIGLNDVTVSVPEGITGLLGPNGAGKSSFIRIVAGELRPSAGRATVLGRRPFANRDLHRRIGYCPEGDRFFDDMRCRPFLVHLLRLSGFSAAEAARRADAALEEMGIAYAASKRLGALSKGMRQRLKLAQAVAHDPEVLLLDEPLSGLDPVARHETQEMLRRRAAEGVSILVSSHVLHEVEELTTRVLLIHHGRIAATGEIREIRSLINRHPHRIRVECEEPRRLAALIVGRSNVRSIGFEEAALTLETLEPDSFYADLPALVVENGLDVRGLSSPDDHLQAVFDILVRGES